MDLGIDLVIRAPGSVTLRDDDEGRHVHGPKKAVPWGSV